MKERDAVEQAKLALIKEEKLKKHEEMLKKIKDNSHNRRQKMETDNKMLKEVFNKKPLFQMYEEKYQVDFVAKDLEEQKKILQ